MHRLPHLQRSPASRPGPTATAPTTCGSTTSRPSPGIGYPRSWEDQERWKGGWGLDGKGRLALRAGGRLKKLATIFGNLDLPLIDDYYEPWTYDYASLITAPASGRPRR